VSQELEVIQRAAAAVKVAWKHDAGDAAEPPAASMEGARAPLADALRRAPKHVSSSARSENRRAIHPWLSAARPCMFCSPAVAPVFLFKQG